MACEFTCDGCGEKRPGAYHHGSWFKPHDWFERADDDGPQTACSRACVDRVAKKTGKHNVILPI